MTKTALDRDSSQIYYPSCDSFKRNTLFAGSRTLSSSASAVVIRSGFQTSKGSMIRDILYPKEISSQFVRDSYYFVAAMAMVSVVAYLFSIPRLIALGFSYTNIFFRSADLLTTAIPPSLPAILASSVAFTLKRMKNQSIYCIQPGRVNIVGRISTMVFDKTGTLTEDGLEVLGHQAIQSSGSFSPFNDCENE